MSFHVHVLVDGLRVRHYWTDFGPEFQAQATIDADITELAAVQGKPWRIDVYDPDEDYTYVLASHALTSTSMPINLGDWSEGRS